MKHLLKVTAFLILLITFIFIACGGKSAGGNGTSADTTPPSVQSTSPSEIATGVSILSTIAINFTTTMDQSTIGNTTFKVFKDGTIVNGTISYPTATSALFTPSSSFDNMTLYTVTIKKDIKATNGISMTADYVFNFTTVSAGTLPSPAITPSTGIYDGEQTVAITCIGSPSAIIKYTINDSNNPSLSYGNTYSSTFKVSVNSVVKAMAYQSGSTDSGISNENIKIRVAQPNFSPSAGTHGTNINVSLTQAAAENIYYTFSAGTVVSPPDDPDDPTTASTKFTTNIPVTGNGTVVKIKAISVKSGMEISGVTTIQTYTIDYSITPALWDHSSWDIHKWGP